MKVLFEGRITAVILDNSLIGLFSGMNVFSSTKDKEFIFLETPAKKKLFFDVLESIHTTLLIMPEVSLKK